MVSVREGLLGNGQAKRTNGGLLKALIAGAGLMSVGLVVLAVSGGAGRTELAYDIPYDATPGKCQTFMTAKVLIVLVQKSRFGTQMRSEATFCGTDFPRLLELSRNLHLD